MEEVDRKQVTTIREYLAEAVEARKVFHWVLKAMVTPESKQKLKGMFIMLTIAIVLQCLMPYLIGFIFQGLTVRKGDLVIMGLIAVLVGLIVQRIIERTQEKFREWVFGLHWVQFDDQITQKFFGKSIGQHVQDSKTLSSANIDKGRWKVLDLQAMLLFEGVPVIMQLVLSFVLLSIISPVSGLIMGAVIVLYIVWSLYLNARVACECAPIDRDFRKLNRRRTERWERVERVKVSCNETREAEEMASEFAEIMVRDRNFWLWFIKVSSIRSIMNVVGLVGVMTWGIWLVWNGTWNVGMLYPLFAWAQRVSENVWRFGHIEHQINWNLPSVKSMIKALELPPAIVDAPDAVSLEPHTSHTIEFVDVCHTYPPEAKTEKSEDQPPALVKVNFTIKAGQKVALLGGSGSGKTTVMKKLLRFDDPTSGSILIDGIDLRKITQASWRQGIGYIPQQSQVFDGTIRYNLLYGLSPEEAAKVTDDDLWQLMRLLQIDFGDRLTKGLDTVVGKGGLKLSGGQAQRLMIGAAVIKRPWLLVVDEATSSLDSTTERKVHDGLKHVLTGTTTSALIVAHRLSTVRDLCDTFIILRPAGEVKEGESQVEAIASSFEELYHISPTFRQLADDQGIPISIAA